MTDTESSTAFYRERIKKILSIYPRLSPSMLHTGLGPSTPAQLWKPILQQMVDEGLVKQEITTVGGRSYTTLELANPPHSLKTAE